MHCHWTHLGRVLSTINVSAVESRNRYVLLQCNNQQLARLGSIKERHAFPVLGVQLT